MAKTLDIYIYDPIAKTVDLSAYPKLTQGDIVLVVNTSRNNAPLYWLAPDKTGVLTNGILTITADTTGHSSNDKLSVLANYEILSSEHEFVIKLLASHRAKSNAFYNDATSILIPYDGFQDIIEMLCIYNETQKQILFLKTSKYYSGTIINDDGIAFYYPKNYLPQTQENDNIIVIFNKNDYWENTIQNQLNGIASQFQNTRGGLSAESDMDRGKHKFDYDIRGRVIYEGYAPNYTTTGLASWKIKQTIYAADTTGADGFPIIDWVGTSAFAYYGAYNCTWANRTSEPYFTLE